MKKVNMTNLSDKLTRIYGDECEKNVVGIIIYECDGEYFFDEEFKYAMSNEEIEALLLRGAVIKKDGAFYSPASFNSEGVSFSAGGSVNLDDYITEEELEKKGYITNTSILSDRVVPNPNIDGIECEELTSIDIGNAATEPVTTPITVSHGAYTKSSSTIGHTTTIRAYVVMDVLEGDVISLQESAPSWQFLIYKLKDGTTTYESDLHPGDGLGYSKDPWTSDADQHIIIVMMDADNPNVEVPTSMFSSIIQLTRGEVRGTYFKVIDSELHDEMNLINCDFGKEMTAGINYYVESDVMVCKCTLSALEDSIIKIFTAVGSGVARGSGYFVDFANKKIGMYAGISSTSNSLTINYSKDVGFDFVEGHEYVIECMKKAKKHSIKITDAYSLESESLVVMPTSSSDIGEHWGKRTYTASSGVTVNNFKNYSLEPHECRLLIIGDSFIEGATGFADNHQDRYCARMKRLLKGSCAINGFGGATTEQVSAFYEAYCKTLFKPEYVLIACGTNNTTYSTWLTAQQELIASIKSAGSIPVLVTITRRLDNDNLTFMKQANDWIRNESGELFIDINRITTADFDGETQNSNMFAADAVHPNAEAHELIVKKALIDVPEIFNMSGSYIKDRDKFGRK